VQYFFLIGKQAIYSTDVPFITIMFDTVLYSYVVSFAKLLAHIKIGISKFTINSEKIFEFKPKL